MKTLNFFRKPYLTYVISFMFLFVSCKQYDTIDEEKGLFKYSQKDIDDAGSKLLLLKQSVNDAISNKNTVDPFELASIWYYENYNSNIIPIEEQYKNDLLSFTNLNNNKSNYNDVFDFIEQNNFYSQDELDLLYQLKNDIVYGNDFASAISTFENAVYNSNFTTERKNALIINSFILSSLNSIYPNAFQNNMYNKNVSCVVSAIGLAFAIGGLIVASGGTALGAAIAGGGYVTSLIGTGLSCFGEE